MPTINLAVALVRAIKLVSPQKADQLRAYAVAHGIDLTKVPGYQE